VGTGAIINQVWLQQDMQLPKQAFSHARVLIVGDLMLDRYWFGSTSRISPEAPVPVVKVAATEERPGGAGNVALNAASLGANVCLIGVVGRDEAAESLKNFLEKQSVECRFVADANRSTITKLRVLSQHQQLIRLDFDELISPIHAEELLRLYHAALEGSDVVVLSDYAKGTLSQTPELIRIARAAGKPEGRHQDRRSQHR